MPVPEPALAPRSRPEASDPFLAALLDSPEDVIIGTTLDGVITLWNPAAERVYGYPAAEALGQPITLIVPESRRAESEGFLRAVARGERVVQCETVRVGRDGRQVVASLSITPVRDAAGAVVAAASIARDVTSAHDRAAERERLLARAAEEQRRLESVVKHLPVGVVIAEAPLGRLVLGNDAVERLLGHPSLPSASVAEYDAWRGFHPDGRRLAAEEWPLAEAILRGRTVPAREIEYHREDGSRIWLSVTAAPVVDAEGRVSAAVAVFSDVTDSHLHARRAEALAEASRAIGEASLDVSAVLDAISRRAAELVGDVCVVRLVSADGAWLEPAAVFHRDPAVLQALGPLVQSPFRVGQGVMGRVASTGRPEIIVTEHATALSAIARPEAAAYLERLGLCGMLCVPLRARGRNIGALAMLRAGAACGYSHDDQQFLQDVADRTALAVDNARLYLQAQAAVQVRDEVLAAVSHDLKTPLTSIRGTAQLLRLQAGRGGSLPVERVTARLQRIEDAANRMASWIDELSDAARLQIGQSLALRRVPTDLVALVFAAAAEHQQETQRHHLQVDAQVDELVGEWDGARLRRVLDNLLSNAIKYSPEGGEIDVQLGLDEVEGRPWAVLRVSDRGVGIPSADLPHVFEGYRRARNVGKIAGSGIGLAGALRVVQQHGGRIEVSSVEGAGSTFTLCLPLQMPD